MITNKDYTTSFISLPKKVVLLTYDKQEEGQYYYNCSFNIPTDIPPGPQGSYMVTFNEALFQNSHPVLYKDDYITFIYSGREDKVLLNEDVYNLNAATFISKMNTFLETENIPFEFFAPADGINPIGLHNKGVGDVDFEIEYSVSFGYIFNNINISQSSTNGEIIWRLVRFNGPFNYIIKTNLIPVVPTLNELGQTYNMTLLTYNVTSRLGEYVQMASTMQCVTKNITKLKIELVNDQGDPVKITTPIYIQVTVEPYLPYKENTSYYKN